LISLLILHEKAKYEIVIDALSMPDSHNAIKSLHWAFENTINGFNGVSIMVAVCREEVYLEWQGLLTNYVENVGFTEMRSLQGSGRMCTRRFFCCPAEY
jgi:hypothetical protein